MLLPTVHFCDEDQVFKTGETEVTGALVESMNIPLSLTFQLTRNCNFRCVYCSEPPGIRSRSLDEIKSMVDRLRGMRRIILSGGEPMAYKHFWEILEYTQGKFEKIVLSTNASFITRDGAARLKDLVDYIDITVDGPRQQHNMIRGNYDKVIRGLRRVAEEDIPLSVICVFLPRNHDAIQYICQTGDIFSAVKVKILTPIPKGEARNIFTNFVTGERVEQLGEFLQTEKQRNGWQVRITIADWMRIGQGHAILVEPDGRMIASPVWDHPDCLLPFGNLAEETAERLWQKYPYKTNHLNKYLERSMIVL